MYALVNDFIEKEGKAVLHFTSGKALTITSINLTGIGTSEHFYPAINEQGEHLIIPSFDNIEFISAN